jgi:hypothetical protein
VQVTGRRIGEGWCRRRYSNERGGGNLRRESGVRVFSRRQSGLVPLFSRPESPSAPRGAGDGLASPDGLRAYSGGKREIGGAAGPNNIVRIKKMPARGLVGETAGDAVRGEAQRDTLRERERG